MKQPQGFQKPLRSPSRRAVGLARISYVDGGGVVCSCGWTYVHVREKVREDAVDRHINRKHNGRGIRL